MKKSKIPGIFRKKYNSKILDKKIIKRIHIPKDREMIRNLFVINSDDKMELVHDIPKEILVRLKPLAKTIIKNRGMVSRWKASVLILIVAAVLIFNFFFKDRLVTSVMESGLESVFNAKVKINKLKISLLRGTISYNTLTIADAGNTFRNLLETGPAEFKISIEELTKKRVKIEEMTLTGVKWNTPRTGDGTITESAKEDTNENNSTSGVSLDVLSLGANEFNFKQLLEEQKDNLISINIINQGSDEIDAFTQRWEGVYSEKSKEITELSNDILSLKFLSIKDIGSIKEGQSMIAEVQDMYLRITETKDGLLVLQAAYQEERQSFSNFEETVKTAINDDIVYLTDLMDFSSGDMRSIASDAAEKYIRNRWNSYYENGLKALEVYERFQNREKKESKKKKGLQRGRGRNISFLSPDAPGFLIEHILLSGGDSSSSTFSTEIRTVSSEPDKLTEPLTFLADWVTGQTSVKMDGVVDMRSDAGIPFRVEIESPENTVSLKDGIPFLNISSLSSKADISGVSIAVKDENTVLTTLEISLTELDIAQENEEGFISETLKDLLDDLGSIDLLAEILISRNGLKEVKVQSDLDDILSDRIGAYLKDMSKGVAEELRNSLSGYISPYLEKNQILQSSLKALDADSLDYVSSVDDLKITLDDKQNELKKQTGSILEEQEAEASRLKAEAEKKAQDEAAKLLKQVKDKIKLPGF